ncbi:MULTISPECIES: hypothetical protein [unclassified Paludibacterium]|uniref:hypothetical protein n=1 Tax=unclassified Paludibacterium TaxID=2618429 RepID=UPI001C049991|nr:hypothetical protein [Paludibacterium sp. B53371]BEV73736.1 hypothetical protein THUN1379_32180 [Paludibacterium sp. THUN1379]
MFQGLPEPSLVSTRFSANLAWLFVEGPWDAERVRLARDVFEEARAVQPLHAPWGLIVVVLGSTVCAPDALLSLRAAAQRDTRSTGRVATAWVLAPGLEGRSVMEVVLHTVYEDVGPLEVFTSEAAAEVWIRQHLQGKLKG